MQNLFSKDHARSRLTPFCAKRMVSTYTSFEGLKKMEKSQIECTVWRISGYNFSSVF